MKFLILVSPPFLRSLFYSFEEKEKRRFKKNVLHYFTAKTEERMKKKQPIYFR